MTSLVTSPVLQFRAAPAWLVLGLGARLRLELRFQLVPGLTYVAGPFTRARSARVAAEGSHSVGQNQDLNNAFLDESLAQKEPKL